MDDKEGFRSNLNEGSGKDFNQNFLYISYN